MILEEFDSEKSAVINADMICSKVEGMPKIAVSCFSVTTFMRMVNFTNAVYVDELHNASGSTPIYKCVYKGVEIALALMLVGAPTCIGELEELFQMGIERLILFGTCGVLDKNIKDCSIIIPNCAVRDEGTSYHYAPPSDEIKANELYKEQFKSFLDGLGVRYTEGKTWTTDAFYRETAKKVALRKQMGCICVDMECSAVAAFADFREKEILQFFYAADNLDAEKWDKRSLSNSEAVEDKDKIFYIALEFALKIAK